MVSALRLGHWWWSRIIGLFRNTSISGVVGLVSALRVGHGWWSRMVFVVWDSLEELLK